MSTTLSTLSPVYIIIKILNLLPGDIDRLCMLLTCKQLFALRDHALFTPILFYKPTITMNSFKVAILNSCDNQYCYTHDSNSQYIKDGTKRLKLKDCAPLKVGDIPDSVTHIEFDYNFMHLNKLVDGVFPSTIHTIEFGTKNTHYSVTLPSSVEVLEVSSYQDLSNPMYKYTIPNNVKILKVPFTADMVNLQIPPSVTDLVFTNCTEQRIVSNSIHYNQLNQESESEPLVDLSNIKHLEIQTMDANEYGDTDNIVTLSSGWIPPNLESLKLTFESDQRVDKSTFKHASSLTYLELTGMFNHRIGSNVLPHTLTILKLSYNHEIVVGMVPPNVEELDISGVCKIQQGALPSSLERFKITQWKNPMVGVLPSSLLYFETPKPMGMNGVKIYNPLDPETEEYVSDIEDGDIEGGDNGSEAEENHILNDITDHSSEDGNDNSDSDYDDMEDDDVENKQKTQAVELDLHLIIPKHTKSKIPLLNYVDNLDKCKDLTIVGLFILNNIIPNVPIPNSCIQLNYRDFYRISLPLHWFPIQGPIREFNNSMLTIKIARLSSNHFLVLNDSLEGGIVAKNVKVPIDMDYFMEIDDEYITIESN